VSTTREVAERIILHEYGVTWKTDNELIDAIDKALQAERERAAKIAESDSIISWVGGSTGDAKGTARRIAAAIREGKLQ
jgi:hypothetical protein